MNKYLPIGSVVLLKESNKRLMIFGRKQKVVGGDKEYDYIACLFPEGHIDADHSYLFDHDQIDKVYLMGFHDIEEEVFSKEYLA